jgi:hypothetical protein
VTDKDYRIVTERQVVDARQAMRRLSYDRPVKATVAGNVVDLVQTAVDPKEIPTVAIGKNASGNLEYVDKRTGEIIEAKRSETRGAAMSEKELRKSFRKMREIANANFFGDRNEIMVTLTYKENMQDSKKLYKDMEKFVKKAKRALGEIKYLAAVEPQERGAWHAHMLIKQLNAHSTYWPASDVADLWGHGYVKVTRLQKVDNVGAYLTAYLSNTADGGAEELRKKMQEIMEAGDEVPKHIIKGARMSWYPRGTHIYRASKNCERPEPKKMRPHSADLQSVTAGAYPRYAQVTKIYAEDSDGHRHLINTITQIQLNSKCTYRGADEK